jgi:predicted protein tyrosine phosphatase
MDKPIKHCYWVIPGKLLAGEYPRTMDEQSSKEKIGALIESGVKVFIDLTEEEDGLLPYSDLIGSVTHLRFPIRDVSIPKTTETTKVILDTIDQSIKHEEMVYVHCWGGIGRTGLIIGCWLARHGLGGEKALAQLRELWKLCPKSGWRQSPETRDQELYILNWKVDH